MKILFFGSPQIAVSSLQALVEGADEVIGVVTQPDKPAGRGKKITPCAVARVSREKKLPLFQPEKVRDPSFLQELKKLTPDLIVVVAYGKILPKEVLGLPPYRCINLHFSLLPKYRGAAPVAWALIHGEEKTGVSTMILEEKLDSGPILLQEEVPIHPEDTTEGLSERLSHQGASLLLKTVRGLKEGRLKPRRQDESEATYAPLLKKEDGHLDWNRPARELLNQIRGVTPWPGAFTHLNGKLLKIHKATLSDGKGKPGEVLKAAADGIEVACGKGSLNIQELQLEGKKRMVASEFLKGHPSIAIFG